MIKKDKTETGQESNESSFEKTTELTEEKIEPSDELMQTALYLDIANRHQPINFVELVKNHVKQGKEEQTTERITELLRPSRKGKTAPQNYVIEVPENLKRNDVDTFLQILERTSMKDRNGKDVKILDRSSLPWKFASKALAAYIAQVLIKHFPVSQPFADIKTVAGYKSKNLQSLLSGSVPTGAKEVDDAYKQYKRMKNRLV